MILGYLIRVNMEYPPLGIDDIMPFGKYKGIPMSEIARSCPEYLEWVDLKSSADLTKGLIELYNSSLDDQHEREADGIDLADGYYGLSHSDVIEAGNSGW
jgi:hypothetical protein